MKASNMDFRKNFSYILLGLSLFPLLWAGCGGGGGSAGSYVARRARFSVQRWIRYEFHQSKTFSYGESQIKEGYKVIGYEPSWLIYDSLYLGYPFELLSDLVIGEYDVNPEDGFARGDSSHIAYKKKDIVQLASAINSQLNILLAVTDYGDFGYRSEFFSEPAKKNLLNSLDQALADISLYMGNEDGREHVGLLFDFPKVPWNLRRDYLEFLRRVKKSLNDEEQGKSCLVYVVIPPDDPYQIYARDSVFTKGMRDVSDAFIIRTHNFDKHLGGVQHGPMLPMLWKGQLSLDSMVNYFTDRAKIPPHEIILELPYYGRAYVDDSSLAPRRPLIPLAELMNTIEAPRKIDSLSYCFYKEFDTTTYYFDDTLSLDFKYHWMRDRGLGGISIYGLGYGHGMDDSEMQDGLWEIVAVNFAEPAPRLFFPAMGFLLCFVGFGIVGSVIWHWQTRFALRAKRKSFWFYLSFLLCLIITVVLLILPVSQVPVIVKFIALIILLVFPLGRKAIKLASKARR